MNRPLVAAAAVLSLATALPAAAQFRKPEDAVDYRRAVFRVMGTHFGRVGAMVQGRAPYDAAAAVADIEIAQMMSTLPYTAFLDGTSGEGKGTASKAIWSERAKFDAAAKTMQDAMVKLVAATKTNDLAKVKEAFGPVGSSCKACHDDFRNP